MVIVHTDTGRRIALGPNTPMQDLFWLKARLEQLFLERYGIDITRLYGLEFNHRFERYLDH